MGMTNEEWEAWLRKHDREIRARADMFAWEDELREEEAQPES